MSDSIAAESKKIKLVRTKLDISLFDPTTLRDEVSLEVALSILESHLVNPRADKRCLLEQLMGPPGLLLFLLSGTVFLRVSKHLLKGQ